MLDILMKIEGSRKIPAFVLKLSCIQAQTRKFFAAEAQIRQIVKGFSKGIFNYFISFVKFHLIFPATCVIVGIVFDIAHSGKLFFIRKG